MKNLKKTATLLIAVFMMSTFAFAVSASPELRLVVEGDGIAVLSEGNGHGGGDCIKLSYVTPRAPWVDWAGVQIPCGGKLADFDASNLNFYYYGDDVDGQLPLITLVFVDNTETWKLVIRSIDTYASGTWEKAYDGTLGQCHLGRGSTGEGTWENYLGGGEWGVGSPLLLDIDAWKASDILKDKIVTYVEVSVGIGTATVFVDDITIGDVTYDFEKKSEGPVSLKVNTVELIPVVRISVNEATVDFGSIDEGSSGTETVTITNEGTVAVSVKAELRDEVPAEFFTDNLMIFDTDLNNPRYVSVAAWNLHLDSDNDKNINLELSIPEDTEAGIKTAVLVFWAEQAP